MPEPCPETTFLLQRLRVAHPGELITYSDFSELVGGVVIQKKPYRNNLDSAIKIAATEGLLFECVRNVGYRMTAQQDVARIAEEKGGAGIRRTVRRWGDALSTVDISALDDSGRKSYTQSAVKLQIVAVASSPEAYAAIAPKLKPSNQFKPTREEMLKALSNAG